MGTNPQNEHNNEFIDLPRRDIYYCVEEENVYKKLKSIKDSLLKGGNTDDFNTAIYFPIIEIMSNKGSYSIYEYVKLMEIIHGILNLLEMHVTKLQDLDDSSNVPHVLIELIHSYGFSQYTLDAYSAHVRKFDSQEQTPNCDTENKVSLIRMLFPTFMLIAVVCVTPLLFHVIQTATPIGTFVIFSITVLMFIAICFYELVLNKHSNMEEVTEKIANDIDTKVTIPYPELQSILDQIENKLSNGYKFRNITTERYRNTYLSEVIENCQISELPEEVVHGYADLLNLLLDDMYDVKLQNDVIESKNSLAMLQTLVIADGLKSDLIQDFYENE